jgi:hypothetical protein
MPSRLCARDDIPRKFRVVHVMIKVKLFLSLFYQNIEVTGICSLKAIARGSPFLR